ncbi:MAG: electron transport complex subunit RsxG [Gammaproteobacteria bacterium]|nr:electron transport complex subunit RsxG [Gammaproteobacteria bacterium]
MIRSSVLLGLIALLGTALLAGVNELTHERILEQEKRRVLQQLNAIVPTALYNNDLLEDVIEIKDEVSFRHPAAVTVYRARMDDQPVAVMMLVTAPDGYNGDIRLLAGIDAGGTVLGVRVVSHRETPGLGDPIEAEKSDWILGFANRSLRNPETGGWAVKRDGGQFDQFTGATISPRAVVRTIHNTLLYFAANRQMLFETPSKSESMKMASQNGE